MADVSVRRRVIAVVVIALGFAAGVLAFHFGSQNQRPEAFGVFIVVAKSQDSLNGTFWTLSA